VRRLLAPKWRTPASSVHLPSAVLVVVAVLCLVGGSATLRHGALGYALLAAGLALGAAFVLLQRRLPRPLLDVRALAANRVLASALAVQLLLYMSAIASIFLLSICMQVSLGVPARTAGQVIAIGSVLMAVAAPIAGRLSDRFRPGSVALLGVCGVLASALLATRLEETSPLVHVALIVAIQGLGFAFFSSPNMTIIMGGVPAAEVGTASALGAKARSLGMIAGMLVTAILISLAMGNDPLEEHPDRVIHVVGTAFAILAALDVLALVVSIRTRRAG
jgi:MFS family permease